MSQKSEQNAMMLAAYMERERDDSLLTPEEFIGAPESEKYRAYLALTELIGIGGRPCHGTYDAAYCLVRDFQLGEGGPGKPMLCATLVNGKLQQTVTRTGK